MSPSRVASLEAQITANVSGFQTAAGQVRNSLNNIAKEAKMMGSTLGGAMFTAEGATKGWSQAQYTAAFNTERLASRASYLESQVRKGKMTAEQATAAMAGLRAEAQRGEWQAMTFAEKYGIVSKKINAAGMEMAKFGAAAVAVGYAGKQIYDFAKEGATLEYTSLQFDRLSKQAGTTSDILLDDLRVATKGTVSDMGLVQNATDFMRLGLANTSDEVIRLSKVASALNMDMGELTLTLANQSTRRFDQLGVSLDGFKDRLENLKKTGMDTDAAFKEAFLQQAEAQVLKVGNVADTSLGNYKRLEAELKNYMDLAKKGFANMGIPIFGGQSMNQASGQVANTLQAMRMLMSGDYQVGGNFGWDKESSQITFDVVRRNKLLESIAAQQAQARRASQMAGAYGYNVPTVTPNVPNLGYSFGWQNTAQQAAAVAQAAPIDYANALKGGLDLTQMSAQYTAQSAALNQQLSEQTAILDQLGIRYTKTGKDGKASYMEQADKVDALKQAVKDLDAQYSESMASIAMNTLKAKGATDEQTLNFAKASGQISQDAYNQAVAMGKVTDAYMSGKIGADDYASVVAGLSNLLKGMSGTAVNTYIDVWIRQHGSMPGVGAFAPGNINLQGTGYKNTGGPGDRRWTGGPLTSAVTLVGDAPGGGMTPYTEAIINGYVVDAKTTRKLYEMGMLKDAESRMQGGDVYTGSYPTGGGSNPPRQPKVSNAPRVRMKGSPFDKSGYGVSADTGINAATVTIPGTDTTGATMQVGEQRDRNITQNFENSAQQQTQAQRDSTDAIVSAIEKQTQLIAKLPNKDDAYTNARAAQQMNV